MNIVFICTGNTCRSPMAEYIAKKAAEESGIECSISSAGLYVNDIDAVSEKSVEAMNEIGIDISSHIPTQLDQNIIAGTDYFVPMTASHKAALISAGVDSAKILSLGGEVPDPYGQPLEVYRACRDRLISLIKPLMEQFKCR